MFTGCLIEFKVCSVLIHLYSQQFNDLLRCPHYHEVRNDEVTAGLSGKTVMSVKIKAALFNFHIHFNGFNFTRLLWKATDLDVAICASKIDSDLMGYKKHWCLCILRIPNYNPAVSTHIQQQRFSDSGVNKFNSASGYLTPCRFIATIQIEFSNQISINRTPFMHDWLIAVHALFFAYWSLWWNIC